MLNDVQAENRFIFALNFGQARIGVFVLVTDIQSVIISAIAGSQKLVHDPEIPSPHVQHTRAFAQCFKVKSFDVTETFTPPPAPDREARDISLEELLPPPVVGIHQLGVHGIGES